MSSPESLSSRSNDSADEDVTSVVSLPSIVSNNGTDRDNTPDSMNSEGYSSSTSSSLGNQSYHNSTNSSKHDYKLKCKEEKDGDDTSTLKNIQTTDSSPKKKRLWEPKETMKLQESLFLNTEPVVFFQYAKHTKEEVLF